MRVLILRIDAPLVSFGAPVIDQYGVIQPFPGLSLLTGMLANALGWDHREFDKLAGLQDRIQYAARIDRRGVEIIDYQTVDLGLPSMRPENVGWTTRGHLAERGGASSETTHQRYRHYRADSLHTVAVTFTSDGSPTVDEVAAALRHPARPLFIGRKCCLPAGPLLHSLVDGDSLVGVLATTPRAHRADPGLLPATWWDGENEAEATGQSRAVPVTDERDWPNQIHVGRRLMREGHVNPPEQP